MTFRSGDVVLVDTNVIIEGYRTGCWKQLAQFFKLHTVEKVIEETQTGFQNRDREQNIDQVTLIMSLAKVAPISEEQRATFNIKHNHPVLDAGERDLLIYAETLSGAAWLLNTPDVAAVRFAANRDWMDRLVSLEAMIARLKCRLKENLARNYTEKWLSEKKTWLLLNKS